MRVARQRGKLLRPRIDDVPQFGHTHARHGEIVPRREADDTAAAGFAAGYEQIFLLKFRVRRIRLQRRKIIVENKGLGVGRISYSSGAGIAGHR